MARELTPAAIMELNRIVHDSNSQDRDKIAAAIAISDRGCGKPAIGVFHGGALPMEQTEDSSPVSALLRAARGNSDERALAELYAEARRIEAKLAQDKQEHEAHLADAAEALAKGEEVDGLTALLLKARAANAEEPPPRPTPPRIEATPDFIVDSAGHAAPAASTESAPPAREAVPLQVEPEPAPAPAARPARKPTGFPGFDEFSANKARMKQEDEERAKKVEAARVQGRPQISREEAFPPDPRESPEVVTPGRVAGGRGIRRVN